MTSCTALITSYKWKLYIVFEAAVYNSYSHPDVHRDINQTGALTQDGASNSVLVIHRVHPILTSA